MKNDRIATASVLLITKAFDYGKNVTWSSVDLQLASTSSCIVATVLLKKYIIRIKLV